MTVFSSFDFLLPSEGVRCEWPVIACDQFTSEPEYWNAIAKTVGAHPSALHLIYPEAFLGEDRIARIEGIGKTMQRYLTSQVFTEYRDAFVYVERTQSDGSIRRGVVGVLDLEQYDYQPDSKTPVRATEKTVAERIPPRVAIRRNAPIELSHVIALADDPADHLLGFLESRKERFPKLYDVELMGKGGHLTGWLVSGEDARAFQAVIASYESGRGSKKPLLYAIGDGNHSLATAKACYEELKRSHPQEDFLRHPARFAMVEVENIREKTLIVEPIHRIVTGCDANALLHALEKTLNRSEGNPIRWRIGTHTGVFLVSGGLPVALLQSALDRLLRTMSGTIDYIHGVKTVETLCEAHPDALGFELPNFEMGDFFASIEKDGVLPRKTFSMGEATDKRYYLEARRIKPHL